MRRAFAPMMAIVPEGWLPLALLAAGVVVLWDRAEPLRAVLLFLSMPVVAYYFADRNREVLSRPRGILAPVDGVVVHRRECFDPLLQREAIRITLKVSPWGAYCLRAPLEGEVLPLNSGKPVRTASRIQTDELDDVVLRVTRGTLLGVRPVWIPFGERVGQGRRCGVRRLLGELELLLPAHARVEVELGQRVRCGQTLLATLLRKTDARSGSS
jgi:phosphatidylserine decarboxylase